MLWDGGAKSVHPNCLMSGPVGEKIKALPDNLKSFVDFKKIDAIIPIVSPKILENQDVKNMYELCKMIITGKKNMKLEKINLLANKMFLDLLKTKWGMSRFEVLKAVFTTNFSRSLSFASSLFSS